MLVLPAVPVYSQEREMENIDVILDSLLFGGEDDLFSLLLDNNRNYHFLFARINYDSKTTWAGREVGEDQYNLSGQVYYFNSMGFHVGLAGSWYSQTDPGYNTTVLSAGYSNGPDNAKWLRYRAAYNRYFYAKDTSGYEPSFNSSLNAGVTLKLRNSGTRFDYSAFIGSEWGHQLSWDLYTNVTLLKFTKGGRIETDPSVSFFFGTEAVGEEQYLILRERFPGMPSTYSYDDRFGLLNTQLSLPISLSIGNFDIEIGYNYNFTRSLDDEYSYSDSGYLNLSVGYIIMIK